MQTWEGGVGDFALVVPRGGVPVHYRRENDTWGFPWRYVATLDTAVRGVPALVAAGDGLELVVRDEDARLVAYRYTDGAWQGPEPVPGVDRAEGDPALVAGPEHADLLLPRPGGLTHYRRTGRGPWRRYADLTGATGPVALSATDDGLDLIARTPDGLAECTLPDGATTWTTPHPIPADLDAPVTGLALAGTDLVVAAGGNLAHLRRTQDTWERRPDLPAQDGTDLAVSMMRGAFGNLELAVFDTAAPDAPVTPCYLDQASDTWSALPAVADGQKVFGDLSIFAAALDRS